MLLPSITKSCFGAKNRDVTSLQHKFISIANITLPTGDPNIPGYVLLAKDVMRAIEIKMDSGEIGNGDLRSEGMAEFEEDTRGEDGSNLLEESQVNEEELQAVLQECNNQQLEAKQCPN